MKKIIIGVGIFGLWLLSGCNANSIPTEPLELNYLDEQALKNPEQELTYSDIDGMFVHDYIKENKDKAVRWTATVKNVEDEHTYELQEPLLPSILVTFIEAPDEKVETGDLVTFTGVLTGYGETFGKDPLWVVRPAKLEVTTEEEREEVAHYQQAAENAKKEAESN
ncbi:hypothetical protein [Sutcliffiella deserti]|uniref:hypothetical protein n=1 Tax=Sutcliffiella deserti TaxID=2875501 RepID=UPI001CC14FEA|nr:hypothetical protein [Sutcliffiella deserti]